MSNRNTRLFTSAISVSRLANLVIPSGVQTVVPFDTTNFDRLGEYNTTLPNNVQVREAGFYLVSSQITWQFPPLGFGYISLITQNLITDVGMVRSHSAVALDYLSQSVNKLLYMAAGESVQVEVFQGVGAPVTLQGGERYTFLSMVKMG